MPEPLSARFPIPQVPVKGRPAGRLGVAVGTQAARKHLPISSCGARRDTFPLAHASGAAAFVRDYAELLMPKSRDSESEPVLPRSPHRKIGPKTTPQLHALSNAGLTQSLGPPLAWSDVQEGSVNRPPRPVPHSTNAEPQAA